MEQLTDALQKTIFVVGVLLGSFFGLIFLTLAARIIVLKLNFKKHLEKGLSKKENVFLSVKIPSTNEQKEEAMESFLRSLHRVLPTGTYLSLEMLSSDQFLKFYIVVHSTLRKLVESQLYAQFPDAEVEETDDYFSKWDTNTAVVSLKFKHSSINPIKTHKELEDDLLKNLSAVLSKTEPGEKATIQLLLKRVGSKSWEKGIRPLWKQHIEKSATESPSQTKLNQDLYLGRLRIAYTAENIHVAKTKLHTLINLFKSVKGHNELIKPRFSSSKRLPKSFKARAFETGELWSIPEIATLYHFPYKGSVVSNVVETNSRKSPAPDILPFESSVSSSDASFFGETNYRSEKKVFGIKRIDRRRHLYIVGKTGSGKSRLLELLLISDIQSGQGCCLLDPHGDLANELLMFVPKNRIKDVVYVNPTDRDFPIGFNPLEPVEDYESRQHLSVFFIAIFKKLFAANWNPRMEHMIRYITLALLETPDSNIMGIPRILSDTSYRQRVVKQIKDPVVKSFWTNEFASYNERFSSEAIIPIINKVGQFISNPIIRNMIGQQKNTLDFEKYMNEGKIVIINISKGKLGDDNAALLGSMFITKIQQAALARAKMKEEERRDFYFYVDEFQNFATDAFSSILSEARKYRLDLTIAHQYIAQLPEEVKATAFGNVGSMITFAIGGDDASYLSKEFSPVFTPDDMINLNTREMYVKMSVDGRVTKPFSAVTIDVPKPEFDYSIEIVDHSRISYGKNRVHVEQEINRWTTGEQPETTKPNEDEFPEPII
jgi:hypothetical protein